MDEGRGEKGKEGKKRKGEGLSPIEKNFWVYEI